MQNDLNKSLQNKQTRKKKQQTKAPTITKAFWGLLHNYSGMKERNKHQDTEDKIVCRSKTISHSLTGGCKVHIVQLLYLLGNREVKTPS